MCPMTSEKGHWDSLWFGLFVLLSLIVPALVGCDVYAQWSTPTMDFYMDGWGSAVVHSVVPGGQAESAGLRAGDVILTVDGVPFEHWYSPRLGRIHVLKIERRGEQITLAVPSVRVLQVSFSPLGSAIVVALTFWGVGTLLLWRRFWQSDIRMLFFLSQIIAIALLFPLSYLDPWEPPLWMLALSVASLVLTAPLFFHYVVTYPLRLGSRLQRRWGLLLLYGSAPVAFWGWLSGGSLGMQAGALYSSLVVAAAIAVTVYVYQYRATPDERRRSRLIVFGVLLAGLPPILLYLLPVIVRSPRFIPEWAAGLFLIIAPLSIFYATLRHNLFGIDRLINRALVYVLLSLGVFTLYLGPYLLLFRILPDDLLLQMVIVSGLTLWVGWTFDWMRTRVQRLVDRFFYGGWYDYPVVVETISDALVRSTERKIIFDVLTHQVPDLMQLSNACLWIGESKATFPAVPPSQARFRFKFQSDVPAQWTVGPHRDGDDLSDMDHRILNTLAHQAEVALDNVLLIEALRHRLDEIQASREALAQTQHRLLRSREDERARLARDLHDSPIQSLVGLNIQLGLLLSSRGLAPALVGTLTEMRAEVRRLSMELRQVCAELRPPMLDTLGLGAALRAYAEEWSGQYNIETRLAFPPDATLRSLPGEVAVNIYRVAQEALTNVGKHAEARLVNICLAWEEGKLKMSILDDGRGFDIAEAVHGSKAQGHFGLAGMQERVDLIGGQWSLKSVPGEGTTVQVTWRA
jgi:signal transduction histidine kinase